MSPTADPPRDPPGSVAQWLLPAALWDLPLLRLRLDGDVAAGLAARGLLTVGDLLATPLATLIAGDGLPGADVAAVAHALGRALHDGLSQFAAADGDWPTMRAQLLAPLADADRRLFAAVVGLDGTPQKRAALQQQLAVSPSQFDERLDRMRALLADHCAAVWNRLRREVGDELVAFDGVLRIEQASPRTLLHAIAAEADEPETALRLAAFCLPHACHLHRGTLHGVSPRRFRELLRTLPSLVPQHRLPMPIDAIAAELQAVGIDVPRGVLLHVLRSELRTAIALDERKGDVAVPDPRTPAARLVDLLAEHGGPARLSDLVFAYRERFRFASQPRLLRHLERSSAFLRLGTELWSLRRWHEQELAAVAALVDRTARHVCSEGGRHHIPTLLRAERVDERTTWLVLDRLRGDPRVRLLGRGEACAAGHSQSQVMTRLVRSFRRAAGDVVLSRFVANQPPAQRRLVERLLRHNRSFVQPTQDRIDTLTNYPFNAERMQRLIALVREQLQQRTGYAHAEALKAAVDQTDLGGAWLTPELLVDVLRRNGPFEVLPPDIVALDSLALPAALMRTARQALRDAGEPLTVDDVVRARPDLAEFGACLADVLSRDPLVQTPDGRYFLLC